MNMEDVIRRLTDLAIDEDGYIEKSKANYDRYGDPCLIPKRLFAGTDNYTKYAPIAGHPNGQFWCQTFVNAMFVQAFGKEMADRLLCGKLASASTMEVKDAMIKAGRGVPVSEAQEGDIVFRPRSGGGHVGLVLGRGDDNEIITIEGNTDANTSTANGGRVAIHYGAAWQWCCRPDYAITGWHWVCSGGIWYYQDQNGQNSYGWKLIEETGVPENRHWYYFNEKNGRMITGTANIDGQIYYFRKEADGLEGALCVTDTNGALHPWYV